MRLTDIALIVAAAGAFIMASESGNRVVAPPAPQAKASKEKSSLITCPLRKPEMATIMQAALLGDGTLLVEQQTRTKVRHIKDC